MSNIMHVIKERHETATFVDKKLRNMFCKLHCKQSVQNDTATLQKTKKISRLHGKKVGKRRDGQIAENGVERKLLYIANSQNEMRWICVENKFEN